jgi:inner membrane protein
MPTILSHPAVPLAAASLLPQTVIPRDLLLVGAFFSVLPDVDVVGFGFGIHYGDLFGHRGFTHSLIFALVIALILALLLPDRFTGHSRLAAFVFLLISIASHGLLDAMTDGGLGIAFFSPFSNHRYFLPWRPIAVAPIGIFAFFTPFGVHAFLSELRWIWFPSLTIVFTAFLARKF